MKKLSIRLGVILIAVMISTATLLSGCAVLAPDEPLEDDVLVQVEKRVESAYGTVVQTTTVRFNYEKNEPQIWLTENGLISYAFKYFYMTSALRYTNAPKLTNAQSDEESYFETYQLDSGIFMRLDVLPSVLDYTMPSYAPTDLASKPMIVETIQFATDNDYLKYRATLNGLTIDEYQKQSKTKETVETGAFFNRRVYEIEPLYKSFNHKLRAEFDSAGSSGSDEARLLVHGGNIFFTALNSSTNLFWIDKDYVDAFRFNYVYATADLNGSNGASYKEAGLNVFAWSNIGETQDPVILTNNRPNLPVWYITAILATLFISFSAYFVFKILHEPYK